MAKNMTRKGLAFGAGIALVATGLVSTPAYAVDAIATGLGTGTSYNTLSGTSYGLELETNIASGSWTAAKLKYRVQNPDGKLVRPQVANAANGLQVDDNLGTHMATYDYGTASTAADESSDYISEKDFVVAMKSTSSGIIGVTSAVNRLKLDTSYATANLSVTVTAWIDENGNNTIDSTEYAAESKVVNFYLPANVTATTTLTPPVIGDASLVATTTTTPALNGGQLPANTLQVAFTAQDNTNAVLAQSTTSDGTTIGTNTWSSVNENWVSTAYLAYSLTADRWNGTDATVADVDLAAYTYGNGASTTNAILAKGSATSLTAAAGVTHYLSFGLTDASQVSSAYPVSEYNLLKAVGSVTFNTNDITFTTTGLTSESVSTDNSLDTGTLRALVAGTNATAVAGTYSATAYVSTTKLGATSSSAPATAVATQGDLTVSSNINVSPATDDSNSAALSLVREDTTSVEFTYVAEDTDGVALVAGRPVVVSLSNLDNNYSSQGTTQSGTFKINGATAPVTLLTDASGTVTFTLTEDDGADASQVQVTAIAEGVIGSAAAIDLNWEAAAYTLYDLNVQDGHLSNRSILEEGSYTFDMALLDQWKVGANAAKYRMLVTTADRSVSSGYVSFDADGTKAVTVTDGQVGSNAYIDVTVDVQVLSSAGTWGTYASGAADWDDSTLNNASDDEVRIAVIPSQTDAVVLDADAGTTYDYKNAGVAADLVDYIALKDVVASDRRASQPTQAAYTNFVTLNGKVQNSSTSIARGGATVTISGPSNVLFSVGDVDTMGSITTVADENGLFTVNLASNIAQKDTVITMTTADGASKTQKVTFLPAIPDSATAVSFAGTPDVALPGSTFQVTITLTDKYGNPVDTTQDLNAGGSIGAASTTETADIAVTYTGAGIVFGQLPTTTDANGQIKFAVLLGANDSGAGIVTVSYDPEGDTTTTKTYDFAATKTVTIGSAASNVTSWTSNQNDGTVKMYAKNVIGAGKVQFMVNGEEIAWVRAANALDSKLRLAGAEGAAYLVRTVDLVEGQKNVLEIYVDGVRTTRSAYTY